MYRAVDQGIAPTEHHIDLGTMSEFVMSLEGTEESSEIGVG